MVVVTNGREIVHPEQIKNLNQLSWDKKHYSNWVGDEKYWLEITYYFNGDEFRYKVMCKNYREVELLRAELDENTIINENGQVVSKK